MVVIVGVAIPNDRAPRPGTVLPYGGQTPTVGSLFPNNQWAAGAGGVSYDSAGNQMAIAIAGGTTTRPSCASTLQPGVAMLRISCYDAENRMTVATTAAPVTTTYVYDGDGRRVQKTIGSTVTTFVYDAQGRLAAEYGGPPNPLTGTTYLTGDHLGSTRLVTNSSGTVLQRLDYAPFGEELTAGIDGRTAPYSANQYPTASPDGTSQKFTSKERDAETGLDFFGARYLSSAQGRFTSPDWSESPQADPYADLKNPQTLNLYVYVGNNPLSFTDSDGHAMDCSGDNAQGAGCQTLINWNAGSWD